MTINFEELVQLYQNGQISESEFALQSEFREEYIEWCNVNGYQPNDNQSANLFWEKRDKDSLNGL